MLNSNEEVILWGCGTCGKYIFEYCENNNKKIIAFGDSDLNKVGSKVLEVPVLSVEDIKGLDINIPIIIAIQREDTSKIKKQLIDKGIKNRIYTINEVFSLNGVEGRRNICADFHDDFMENYYEEAESAIEVFWGESSLFKQFFDKLDKSYIVELACGRGRHVSHYIRQAKQVVLVDILEKNINYCKERFEKFDNIQYYVNSGSNFEKLADNTYTSIFSYDSMVHFESIDIYHYLLDTERILKKGGMALYHHSNNHSDYKTSFITGEKGRNYMSMDLFAHFADRCGLEVLEQQVIKWGNVEDGITLLRKK